MAIKEIAISAFVAAGVAAGTTYLMGRADLMHPAVDVPAVIGIPVASARDLAERNGLLLVVSEDREDGRAPAGQVLAQHPLDGSKLRRGDTISVVVSRIPALVKAPQLVGQVLGEAKLRLELAHLAVGKVIDGPSATVPVGSVVSQVPAENNELRPGTPVDLVISKGAELVPVPSVLSRSLAKAKAELAKAGFTLGNIRTRSNDDHRDGVVLEQIPAAEEKAAKGSAVDLVVNRWD